MSGVYRVGDGKSRQVTAGMLILPANIQVLVCGVKQQGTMVSRIRRTLSVRERIAAFEGCESPAYMMFRNLDLNDPYLT